MRKFLGTLAVGAGAVVLAASVVAAQPPKTAPAKSAAKPAAAKVSTKTATGKISKYDAASKTLTITTAKGDENFVLGAKATLHAGGKAITADDLASHSGEQAKVRYMESGGTMTAEMVTVAAPKPAAKTPAKSTKKPGK